MRSFIGPGIRLPRAAITLCTGSRPGVSSTMQAALRIDSPYGAPQ